MSGEGSTQAALAEKELGNAAYKQKKFDVALARYDKAIELDPKDMSFLNNKAAVFFELKEWDKCIEQCQKAIEVGRENRADFKFIAKSLSRMASAYSKKEDYENAKLFFEKSLTEHRIPDTLSKLSEVEKILKEQARKAYINPEIALEEKLKGNELFKKGDYPGAMKHYTEAIKRNPEDAKLFSNRAVCYQKLAEPQLSLKDCDECIRLDPTFVKGYIRKGYALLGLRDTTKARSAFEKALELEPNSTEALEGFKKCAMSFGNVDPEEARKRAVADPEIQKILADPIMQMILEQMTQDPSAFREHTRNPDVAAKIQRLMECGIIQVGHR
ncbi:stress-induced-phosphoprotein 1-like [Tropilaelaps mercedesae]|uniref:Stress-induced-phosphoprotein 1 n=1 Tax=Tropilaelaps mercedesae TaxID=418985 RepID=A0A1V9XXC6_9ACAR|nr:stress-induced-phosphoprotein 1-like [Tropilaelaps mercedesae]